MSSANWAPSVGGVHDNRGNGSDPVGGGLNLGRADAGHDRVQPHRIAYVVAKRGQALGVGPGETSPVMGTADNELDQYVLQAIAVGIGDGRGHRVGGAVAVAGEILSDESNPRLINGTGLISDIPVDLRLGLSLTAGLA